MGGHKKDIPWDSINEGCSESLDWCGPDEGELTEEQVLGLHVQSILAEVTQLKEWAEKKYDRMRYYGDAVTIEDLEFLVGEAKRIERDFR